MNLTPFRRSITANAALSASVLIIPLMLSFVATPIILHSIGNDAYGVYVLVLGFINYSFTFGIGKAAAKYAAEYRSSNSDELVSEAFSAAFWFSLILGACWAIIIFPSASWFVNIVLRIPSELLSEGQRSLQIAALIILLSMLSQVCSFTLQGFQRFDRYAAISVIGSVFLNVGTVLLVVEGFRVTTLLIWNLTITIAMAISFAITVKRAHPSLRLTIAIRQQIRRSIIAYGSAVISAQVFGNILLLFERTWITREFGIDDLAFYVVPMMLAVLLHSLVGSILMVLFPIMNEFLSDLDRVGNLYRSTTKFVLALTFFAFICTAFLGKSLLTLWISEEFAARSSSLLMIHAATFGILASGIMAWNVAESFGKARVNVIFSLLWLVVSGGLMLILGGSWGLEGVGTARLIGVLGVIPLAVFVEGWVLGKFQLAYWLGALGRLSLVTVPTAVMLRLLAQWTSGIAEVGLGLLTGAAVFAFLLKTAGYFTVDELSWMRRSLPWARA